MSTPSNTLVGHQCPKCKQQEELIARVEVNTYMDDNGTDFYSSVVKTSDVEWHAGSYCKCPQCDYVGKMFEFRSETLLDVLKEVHAIRLDGFVFHDIGLEQDTLNELASTKTEADIIGLKEKAVLHFEVITPQCPVDQPKEWFLSTIQLELAQYDREKLHWLIPAVKYNKAEEQWVIEKQDSHVIQTYMLFTV